MCCSPVGLGTPRRPYSQPLSLVGLVRGGILKNKKGVWMDWVNAEAQVQGLNSKTKSENGGGLRVGGTSSLQKVIAEFGTGAA